jgi:hypothetical protein
LVLPVPEICAIENHKFDGAFLHIALRSQSRLRTTSDLTCPDTN